MKEIVVALLINSAFWGFIQFLISRYDRKSDEKDGFKKSVDDINAKIDDFTEKVKSELKRQEKDSVRTQLLVLILLKPEEEQEILTLGEHYFKDLKGNWYMTNIFSNWLKDTKTGEPEWFGNKE